MEEEKVAEVAVVAEVAEVADKPTGEYKYASWRTDQEAKPGFTRELM